MPLKIGVALFSKPYNIFDACFKQHIFGRRNVAAEIMANSFGDFIAPLKCSVPAHFKQGQGFFFYLNSDH